MEGEGTNARVTFVLTEFDRANNASLQKLKPLVTFMEPNIIECPHTWVQKQHGIVDEQDVQMIRSDGSVRLASELELARMRHANDTDATQVLFIDVEAHMYLLQHKWLEFVDYNTLRIPVGWKIDQVRGRTIVRNDQGKFMASYFRGAESFDILSNN